MGIDKQLILDYYELKSASEITAEIYQSLIGVGTAIKEGHIKIEEVFQIDKTDDDKISPAEKINNLLHYKKQINSETGEVE
jgi:diketogulonate reductase-like aldo/keto reductase